MSTHKWIDKICCVAIALALVLTVVFMHGERLGIQAVSTALGYESRLFDTSTVHTVDIVMDDWEGFLETCTDEEYTVCAVVIDGETYKNVAIRAKGNTSLTQVASYGNNRYSFKIEFDHYDSTRSYYGLDKLSLNNIIQDNTYMKDYLSYQMMGAFGVAAPLCSYAYITVNGEDWGLYLAVEGVEEAFLTRNYGSNAAGALYKPDSQSMGGGRGNGGRFDMADWQAANDGADSTSEFEDDSKATEDGVANSLDNAPDSGGIPAAPGGGMPDGEMPAMPDGGAVQMPETGSDRSDTGGMTGSRDVSLVYTDDAYSSYSNIFDNAKTDVTDADKDRLIESLRQLNACENLESVVDVGAVIRYFVVHNFVCNFDSYTGSMIHNYYLYEQDGQLSMIPWDYNLAFGGFQGAQDATALVNYPIDTPVSGGTMNSRPMLAWIFSDETYTALYHEAFSEWIADWFESGYFAEMIDDVQALIAPYVEQDPTKFCTYAEFEAGVETLKTFCLLRAESIRGQLDGTIPATSEAQAADSTVLVDASDLDISAMGTMNNAMGGMDAGMEMRGGRTGAALEGATQVESSLSQATETQGGTRTERAQVAENTELPQDAATSDDSALPDTDAAPDGAIPTDGAAMPGGMQPPEVAGEGQPDDSAETEAQPDDGAVNGFGTDIPDGETDGRIPADSADAVQPNTGTDSASGADVSAGERMQGGAFAESGTGTDSTPGAEIATGAQTLETWVLLGASVAVLVAGLLFAALYRRHR